jgi:hypothetical protein
MLLSYLLDDCHNQAVTHIRELQWFKSMYTLQGKTRPIRHVHFPRQSTYARRTLPMGGPHTWQPFVRRRQIWTDPTAPEKKGLSTQSTARRLTDLWVRTQLLSRASQWSRGHNPSSWQWPTTRLTGSISPACDRYVQYLLARANWTVLNWHRRGLQSCRCWLSHTTPRPSRPAVSPFP